MKFQLSFFFSFLTLMVFSQEKIFNQPINENTLLESQKISKDDNPSYLSTAYFLQNDFNLTDNLIVYLPSGRGLKTKYERTYAYSNRSTSYVYSIISEPDSELILSEYDGVITGMYASQTGEKIIFQEIEDHLFGVSVIDEAYLIDQDSEDDFIELPANGNKTPQANDNVCLATTAECPATTIDVMVVFSTAAMNAWGGLSQSNSFVATAITNFNTALQNSGVNTVTINLVYSGEIVYTESGSLSTDLTRFRNSTDGYMDNIHTLRNIYGADICAYIANSPTNTCGLGYLNSNPTNYSANSAFSATIRGCVIGNYSMAHEMGHNMGLNHDWYVSSSTNPCSHHHGYVNQTAITLGTSSTSSQRWRSIMAYNSECSNAGFNCSRVNRWTNPNVNYNGEPTGVAIGNTDPAHETYGFVRFACVVSNFRPTATMSTNELNINQSDFLVYPNPAKDYLNIVVPKKGKYHFEIFNNVGQLMLKSAGEKINIREWIPGEYHIAIYDENGTIMKSKKVLVK